MMQAQFNNLVIMYMSCCSFYFTFILKKKIFIIFFDVLFFILVYDDGRVCISILHPPGVDTYNDKVSNQLKYVYRVI